MNSGKRAFNQSLLSIVAMFLITMLLGACAATGSGEQSAAPPRQVGNMSCSLKAMVYVREGTSIRNDSDLVELGRRIGVNLTVLQSLGRSSRMVMIRESGPDSVCEMSFDALKNDLQIESVQRY